MEMRADIDCHVGSDNSQPSKEMAHGADGGGGGSGVDRYHDKKEAQRQAVVCMQRRSWRRSWKEAQCHGISDVGEKLGKTKESKEDPKS
jgi:hypothetical protein